MEKTALTHRISASGRRREECRESGGRLLEATAELADELSLRDVRDEEAMTGSGDSHIDEVFDLQLRPAVHHVHLTWPRPSRMSICQGHPASHILSH